MSLLAFVVLIVVALASSREESRSRDNIIGFLKRYGYLDTVSDRALISNAELRHAISLFQERYHLTVDGTLNNETLNLISRPRCGVTDALSQRIGTAPPRWNKLNLTWNFHLADRETLRVTERAFALWAANSSLTFTRNTDKPDIIIAFRDGKHTMLDRRYGGALCPDDLDGPGNVLAHATPPTGSLDDVSEVHIDRMEAWYIALNTNPQNTYHLLRALAHEIGHSLGLPHAENENSLMYAYVTNVQWPVALSLEDVLDLWNLYPDAAMVPSSTTLVPTTPTPTPTITTSTTTTTTKVPETEPVPSLCSKRNVDSVLVLGDRLFVSRKRYAWSIGLDKSVDERPFLLRDYMRFLPENVTRISAAYETSKGNVVIFADDMVYAVSYPSLQLQSSWPKHKTDLGLPSNAEVNAAITTHTGRTYVVYNDYALAEIDDCSMTTSRYGTISETFPGIPAEIHTAYHYMDGHLHFVHRDRVFAYNEYTRTVIRTGVFDLGVIGITCPIRNILRKLWDLLARLSRSSGAYT